MRNLSRLQCKDKGYVIAKLNPRIDQMELQRQINVQCLLSIVQYKGGGYFLHVSLAVVYACLRLGF